MSGICNEQISFAGRVFNCRSTYSVIAGYQWSLTTLIDEKSGLIITRQTKSASAKKRL
jgi:hypothetical protein